jgi:DNA repair photolyase
VEEKDMKIGITERGDAAIHFEEWLPKLDTVDGAILITKNPCVLLDKFQQQEFDFHKCIIHCTITGWGGTYMEPGVPPATEAINAYHALVDTFGPERIVLRVDPIIPHEKGMGLAEVIVQLAKGRTRVSFMDLYRHVNRRIQQAESKLARDLWFVYCRSIHTKITTRKKMLAQLEELCEYTIEVCGEPGLACVGCISARDLRALGLEEPKKLVSSKQRKACSCLAMKTELLSHRGQCKHSCLYCYWK